MLQRVNPRRDPARWVCAFFLLNFFLQRVSVLPGMSIPASVPLALTFVVLALLTGVGELQGSRTLLWLVAAGAGALAAIPQMFFVVGARISFTSWALWVVSWLPLILRFRDVSADDYRRTLRGVAWCGAGISGLSFVFMASQFVLGYKDWFAELVPAPLQVEGYVITYQTAWSSGIYRSNAWFALEPSFLSFMLGVATIAALVARMRLWVTVVTVLGLLTTFSGSGLALVVVAVLWLVLSGRAAFSRGLVVAGVVILIGGYFTPLRDVLYTRIFEAKSANSSTSLRAIEPYVQLYPHWISQGLGTLFGYGAGSSALVVKSTSIAGLLVPTVAKLIFDYGIFAGGLLLILVVSTFRRTPCPALAGALLISTLTIQASSPPLLNVMFAVTAWFAPADAIIPPKTKRSRRGLRIEQDAVTPGTEEKKPLDSVNLRTVLIPLARAINVHITFDAARGALRRILFGLASGAGPARGSMFGGSMKIKTIEYSTRSAINRNACRPLGFVVPQPKVVG